MDLQFGKNLSTIQGSPPAIRRWASISPQKGVMRQRLRACPPSLVPFSISSAPGHVMQFQRPDALIEDPRPAGRWQMLKITVAKFPRIADYPVQERAKSLNRARRDTSFGEGHPGKNSSARTKNRDNYRGVSEF